MSRGKKTLAFDCCIGGRSHDGTFDCQKTDLNSLSPLNFTLICIYVTAELNQLAQKVPVVVKQCVCVPVLLL